MKKKTFIAAITVFALLVSPVGIQFVEVAKATPYADENIVPLQLDSSNNVENPSFYCSLSVVSPDSSQAYDGTLPLNITLNFIPLGGTLFVRFRVVAYIDSHFYFLNKDHHNIDFNTTNTKDNVNASLCICTLNNGVNGINFTLWSSATSMAFTRDYQQSFPLLHYFLVNNTSIIPSQSPYTSATPTPTPSLSPTPTLQPTPDSSENTPTPTPTATPTPKQTATPTPNQSASPQSTEVPGQFRFSWVEVALAVAVLAVGGGAAYFLRRSQKREPAKEP